MQKKVVNNVIELCNLVESRKFNFKFDFTQKFANLIKSQLNILDIKNFLVDLQKVKNCQLLLAKKNKTYGVNKNTGDFVLENNSLRRWKKDDQINFYSGLQILNPSVFNNTYKSKFSINEIWDNLIKKRELSGVIMQSDLFHIGDINTYLDITKDLPLD